MIQREYVGQVFAAMQQMFDDVLRGEAERMALGAPILQRRIEVEHERALTELAKALGRLG